MFPKNPDNATASQLQVLGSHSSDIYLPLIRKFSKQAELQDAVISAVSSLDLIAKYCWRVCSQAAILTVSNSISVFDKPRSEEVISALAAALRLPWDKPASAVRDQLVVLLQKQTGQSFGYLPRKTN